MGKATDSTRKMGEDRIPKLLIAYSLPVYMSYTANAVYNIISRAFIGNSTGTLGIAAISVAFPIMLIQMSFAFLVGMGGSTLAAIKVGEGDKKSANRILNLSFQMIAVLGVAFTIFGNIFLDRILLLFGASREVLPYAMEYGRILLFGCLFQMISIGITNYMRVEGKTGLAMLSVIIGPLINIVFACPLILWLGMGLRGAAYATVLGQLGCAVIIVYHYVTSKGFFRLDGSILKFDPKVSLEIVYLGLSPFAVQFAHGMVSIFLNVVTRKYGGDLAISGMGIVTTLQLFILTPVQAVNMGSQALIGYNYGSKKYDRIRRLVIYGIAATTAILIIEYVFMRVFSPRIVSLFGSGNKELTEFSSRALITFLFVLPLVPTQVQGAGFFQAVRKPVYSIILSLSRQVIVLVPALIILPKFFGLDGVLCAGPIADSISFFITLPLLVYHLRRLGRPPAARSQIRAAE